MNAVITGATKGIGLAIAKKFIEKGNNICICSRSQEDLDKIERNLESLNSNCEVHIFKADLSKKSDVNQFADFSLEKFDKIDILVNNAGIYLGGQIMDEEEGNLEHMINTNLYSAYYLARRIGPQMIERKNGTIINIASIASFMAYPGGGSYSISKLIAIKQKQTLKENLNLIAQFNQNHFDDKIKIEVLSQDKIRVSFKQFGNWFWRNGAGLSNYFNDSYELKSLQGHYELKMLNRSDNQLFVYPEEGKWKIFDWPSDYKSPN